MPRIDPIQLLNCLSVLLSPKGGVKSRDEVERLAGLMTKFSKKLVSKCIYIQILKCTETDLLGLFMGSGGWRLVHTWLTDGVNANNWPLVRELLELLLMCPVGIERLKTNNCPKVVKELSKDEVHFEIRALASKLVEQWLKTVKGEEVIPIQATDILQIIVKAENEVKTESNIKKEELKHESEMVCLENSKDNILTVSSDASPESDVSNVENACENKTKDDEDPEKETLPILKITMKNGKQIISQVDDEDRKLSDDSLEKEKPKDKHRSRSKDKSHDKSRSSKSSSSKHSSKSSSSDKYKSSNKSSSSSKHSSKEKSREKDRNSSHSSRSKDCSSTDKKSTSSKSKDRSTREDKEKSKDKEHKSNDVTFKALGKSDDKFLKSEERSPKTEEKSLSPSIQKLGKIPKLSDVKREKPSISIEVRKPDEPKPKTVKTFNSKFRKHGLEEEVKPPPSRASLLNKKPLPVIPPTVSIPKRPSPVHNETPPEKKAKSVEIEKPGAIKLIPPKPKPMVLQESDMFMDALNASATNKKEPKKRKRRTSGSKDGNAPNEGSPPHTPNPSSPNGDNKSVPPRFYQDTMETEENKERLSEKSSQPTEKTDESESIDKEVSVETVNAVEPHTLTVNGLKGVLCYHKRKGPKKSIKWKPDSELEEIQYFELDETERVNVTKTFTDMKHLERIHERDAFQKGRNLSNDDIMEERTMWRPLILIDAEGQIQVEYGKNSKEKDIQAIRQKGTLQPLYFHKSMIPDSPFEPDPETHVYSEPHIIPLDDITGNQDNISDFRNMPWPEPKGNAPAPSNSVVNVQPIFPPNIPQFPSNFPPTQFPGVPPGFQGPPLVPGDWPSGVPPHILPNGMPTPMATANIPPGAMAPGGIPPGMMVPPENMMMGPEMFGGPNHMFPVPPDGFNMPQNMFPMDFNISGAQAPPGPDAFNVPGNFRGAMRGRGAGGGHWRGKAASNWDNSQRGRGASFSRGGRKAVCIYFQRKGSCRQGDNCTFLHPGVNCPF